MYGKTVKLIQLNHLPFLQFSEIYRHVLENKLESLKKKVNFQPTLCEMKKYIIKNNYDYKT